MSSIVKAETLIKITSIQIWESKKYFISKRIASECEENDVIELCFGYINDEWIEIEAINIGKDSIICNKDK
jgi:hypothetical protein